MIIGYARVSSTGQSLELQLEQLKAAGCEKIYQEKKSGRSTTNRLELERALDQLRPGDILTVTRLDRLARSVPDLYAIVADLNESNVHFRCLQQGAIDTTTPTGKLMFGVLGCVAEFENDLRAERQREGIERAKEKGVYKGRIRSIDIDEVLRRIRCAEQPYAIAKEMGIGKSSVYRIANEHGGVKALRMEAVE